MEAFKRNVKNLTSQIKSRHFPKLRKTFYVFLKSNDYYMAIRTLPFGLSILFVDGKCRKFSIPILQSLIVHELCHFHTDNERIADLEVIRLGYGNGLLAFHHQHNKKYKRYKKHEGLTTKEIEKLLNRAK